jgi:hypothetical protein
MKKFNVFSVFAIIVLMLVMVTLVMAKGPVGETFTIHWCESAIRYHPDDSFWQEWDDDPIGPSVLIKTGKAYHFADIQEYYNCPMDNLSGSLVISGAGRLSGHATYTSGKSGLPIKEHFKGEVTINADDGTMVGTYTQWSYAFGSRVDVLTNYPGAIPAKKQGSGWWFIGYTEYVAHECE